MKRFDRELRKLPSELEYYRESIDLDDNIRLIAKTVYIDFLSSESLATHEANRSDYRIRWPDWAILAALAAALGASLFAVTRVRLSREHPSSFLRREYREAATPGFLAGEFFVGYAVITVVLWSVGNNDPIYSRFMYPSYPFLILWGFGIYSFFKKNAPAPVTLWSFRFFYFSVLAANLYKISHLLGWLH
jgi:hypothetical protein